MNNFKIILNAYPLAFYYDYNNKSYLENSNKILLPSSILNNINKYSDKIKGNILFKLTGNLELNCIVSVDEFIDDISDIYLPFNLIEKLNLNEGDKVLINLVNVIKGSKIVIQPHKSDFLEIEDHKKFLEEEINKYDIISNGDILCLNYNNKIINFSVCETEPDDTISTKNTDIIVDFKEPLDYKEYLNKKEEKKKEDENILKQKGYIPFGGVGRRLGD
mgnify:CR=1 FL=1